MTPTQEPRVRLRLTGVLAAAALVVAALALAPSAGATSPRSTTALKLTTLSTKDYGTILVSTRTVYTLSPSKVPCSATCLTYWPEVLLPKGVAKAAAGHGVNAAKIGSIKRAGGRLQVTYAGKALYWFSSDKSPGQVKGNVNDTWGKWRVVVLVKPTGSSTTTTTTGGGGGGIGF